MKRLIKDKKAQWQFLDRWMEVFFFILLIAGFIFSILIESAFFSYVVVLLFGVVSGRFLQQRKGFFPYYIIILGLLIGFLIGSRYGSWKINLFLFIVGCAISWYAHEKNILR